MTQAPPAWNDNKFSRSVNHSAAVTFVAETDVLSLTVTDPYPVSTESQQTESSYVSAGVFRKQNAKILQTLCSKMIDNNEPISKVGIKRACALNTNLKGKKILQDFTLF